MNKIVIMLFVAMMAMAGSVVSAQECERTPWCVTLKNGYFYPQEKALRDIFDRNGHQGGYWVEGAVRYEFFKRLNIELSGSYFGHNGIALCGDECVKVKIPTLGLGLKYFFCCTNWLDVFIGAGMRVFFYRENDGSYYVQPCVKRTVAGGQFNAGLEFAVYKGLVLDIFADYNVGKVKPKKCACCYSSACYDIWLGGLVAGLGLGYQF